MTTPQTPSHAIKTSEATLSQLLKKGFSKRIAENIIKYDITEIEENKGANYMDEFMIDFPKNTLLDKGKTGVGATSMALRHKDKYVIAVPFKDLATNKKEWCDEEKIDVLTINGDTTSEEIQSYTGNKIIVVYDSLYKVSQHLPNFESFRIMIDEAHILLLSGTFRKRAIYTVFEEYKKYKDFVFLTATIPSRMYDMYEFKNINKAIIKWKNNPQPTFLSHIIDPYGIESLRDVLYTICIEHLKGTRKTNAYIFINSVRAIRSLINLLSENKEASSKDINIIAASSNESQIETDLGKEFSIGKAPTRNSTPKKLNFITSSGFEGQDFYDSNGKVYIVSDGSYDFMKLDLLTQVPQIVGRLRDSDLNKSIPIILVPNIVKESQTIREFDKSLKIELSVAKNTIKERKRLLEIANEKFNGEGNTSLSNFKKYAIEVMEKPEYYVVKREETYDVVVNKLYYLTSLNKWDVKQQGVLAVFDENFGRLKAKYSEVFEMNFEYKPAHNMPIEFIKYRKGKQQSMQSLITKSIELLDSWLSSDIVIPNDNKNINPQHYAYYVPVWVKEAYFTIGKDKMIQLRYSEAKIKKAIKNLTEGNYLHKLIPDELNFKTGEWYSNVDIKDRLKKAYTLLGIDEIAKAISVKKYYSAKKGMGTVEGNRTNGYTINEKII